MTATTDLRSVYDALTTGKGEWSWRFEVDPDTYWWLTLGGHRTQRTKWRPTDEVDVLVAVTLLYSLNEAGAIPLQERHLATARRASLTVEELRDRLDREAYHLFMRLRTGRPRPPANVPPGWRP